MRRITVGAIAVGLFLAILGAGVAAAASPSPSAATGADTRSSGAGPGIVGAPGLAVAGVIAIALLAAGVTVAYVRVTAPRR